LQRVAKAGFGLHTRVTVFSALNTLDRCIYSRTVYGEAFSEQYGETAAAIFIQAQIGLTDGGGAGASRNFPTPAIDAFLKSREQAFLVGFRQVSL
jgi:hypothetical protein